jgi:hypothetical protein
VIPKSEKQQRREAGRVADRAERAEEVGAAEASRREVKVYKDEPFAADEKEITVADESSFAKPPPKPPFELTSRQYRELTERQRPRIAFPKDEPCPITRGEVYEVTSKLSFVVTGITETKTEFELHYELLDERLHNLGRFTGYATSQEGSIATKKAREEQPAGGPQFRDETEPGPLEKPDLEEVIGESRADRTKRLKAHRTLLREQHRRMEKEGVQADVRWAVRLAIKNLDQRIDHEERQLGGTQEAA